VEADFAMRTVAGAARVAAQVATAAACICHHKRYFGSITKADFPARLFWFMLVSCGFWVPLRNT
jgi:hypothetical protein